MKKRPPKRFVGLLTLWDLAWKIVAVRRALKRGERKWAAGLALSNTAGIAPIYYLWRTREKSNRPLREATMGGSLDPRC